MSPARPLKHAPLLTILACLVPLVAAQGQLAPPATGGVGALDRILQQLAETRRVLMVAAHPDDEDTSLLALLARGYGADAAYMALSRGEGGQNLLGQELGPALGLLRTSELLAARETDGARQFFSRAYDFGYTRSIDETNVYWPPDSVLKDVVRVVRSFRPHVIVSTFSGTANDGHGQHQAAGVAAHAAFEAAGDPARFPELASEEGLEPWQPVKLYRSMRFDRSSPALSMATGRLDPRDGRSYHQIAMASRSLHRSQDMGVIQQIGPQDARIMLVSTHAMRDGEDADIFTGVPDGATPVSRFAAAARARIDPTNLAALVPDLVAQLPAASPEERMLLEEAIAVASGLVVDARADDGEVVAGQEVEIELELFNGGPLDVVVDGVEVDAPEGWTVENPGSGDGSPLPAGELAEHAARLGVAADAGATQPYFLERPMVGFTYDWTGAPPAVRGRPFQEPAVTARWSVRVLGAPIALRREVTLRERNQAFGEVRREVRVVPRVGVTLEPSAVVWPVDAEPTRTFTVRLVHNGRDRYGGEVALQVGDFARTPARAFRFAREGESTTMTFEVERPPVSAERFKVRAVAVGDDGRTFDYDVDEVAYPHIRARAWVVPASAAVTVAPMTLPPVARVGYVRGAADRVPEALLQVGVPLEMLDATALAERDLSGYDAIIVGSRAYETDSSLTAHNDRLLAYAREGGLLIVQYQQYQFIRGEYAAHPLDIGRPHDRVTDETAPVTVLEPDHPALRGPNRIGASDWEGWPQERGLYFAQTWDEAYVPLLEMHDAGRPPLQGGLLVAPYGAGTYVYTGLSFFRALPAGTPGAFRLFLNLIGLQPDHVP